MSMKNKDLTQEVKKRMKQTGITEKHIAQYIMRSADDVSSWLHGDISFPYFTVWKIYDFLEIH